MDIDSFRIKETIAFQSWKRKMKVIYNRFGSLMVCSSGRPDEAYICNFYVAEEHRGKGLGTLLQKRAISCCKERGFKAIRLYPESPDGRQDDLIDWYKKFGFHYASEGDMIMILDEDKD